MYIDEVGNADLESSDNPNHRFLSLIGVIIELDYVKKVVNPELEALKKKFFDSHPDDPVIFHRKELMGGSPPFEILKDPAIREKFDYEILELFKSWDYKVVSVCIDKKKHKDTYTTWRFHPYHYCLMILLERYIFFLDQINAKGDVLAESRGGKEDKKLKESFARLYRNGNDHLTSERFSARLTSCQLKIKPKANNISGLQLADLLAHPSRNEILIEQKLLEIELPPFGSKIVDILQNKYYQNRGKMYGKKFL